MVKKDEKIAPVSLHEYILEAVKETNDNIEKNNKKFIKEGKPEKVKQKKTVEQWFNDVVENIKSCKLATHVGKFTNPDIETLVLSNAKKIDGYVTTGGASCSLDIYASATFLPSAKLLLHSVTKEMTVWESAATKGEELANELKLLPISFSMDELQKKSQQMIMNGKKEPDATDTHLKQVYFPIAEGEYHLLSVMPSSCLALEMYQRIQAINGHKINCYDKTSEDYGKPCEEVTGLTMIGFGGTKPQNISALNSRNRGKAYLLSSLPPSLQEVKVRIPKSDFFKESIWYKSQKIKLYQLHAYMKSTRNNLKVRRGIRALVHKIMDDVIFTAYQIRATGDGWSNDEKYANLPHAQKIWLDDIYKEKRKDNDWLQEIAGSFARWVIASYEKTLGDEKILLGDGEWLFIKQFMEKVLKDEVRYE